jgi:hypothetical protein
MKTMTQIRAEFVKARKAYIKDMKWLRDTYGIIPEPENYLIKHLASSALDALTKHTVKCLEQALIDFQNFHKSVLYHVAWDMLERTKEGIKSIKAKNPDLYEKKLKQWKVASWAMTQDIYRQTFTIFKDTIRLASEI